MANHTSRGQQRDKPFRDALRLAIAETEENPRKLRRLAEKLYDLAVDGDVAAIKEIADRTDGKVAQALIGGDDDDPAVKVEATVIQRTILDPRNPDSSGSPPAT